MILAEFISGLIMLIASLMLLRFRKPLSKYRANMDLIFNPMAWFYKKKEDKKAFYNVQKNYSYRNLNILSIGIVFGLLLIILSLFNIKI